MSVGGKPDYLTLPRTHGHAIPLRWRRWHVCALIRGPVRGAKRNHRNGKTLAIESPTPQWPSDESRKVNRANYVRSRRRGEPASGEPGGCRGFFICSVFIFLILHTHLVCVCFLENCRLQPKHLCARDASPVSRIYEQTLGIIPSFHAQRPLTPCCVRACVCE